MAGLVAAREQALNAYEQREAYHRPQENYYNATERISRADALITALDREIQAKETAGVSEESIAPLRELGKKTVYQRNQTAVFNLRDRLRSVVRREESELKRIAQEKGSRNWFAKLTQGVTGYKPYDMEIAASEQNKFSAERALNTNLKEAMKEITKPKIETIDMAKIQESTEKISQQLQILNSRPGTDGVWETQQEMITAARDASILVITAPASFVGGSAAAGVGGAMRAGAYMGGKMAFLDSVGRNTDDVQSGKKTVGEAVGDAGVDTAKGAAVGAALGVAANRVSAGISRIRGKGQSAPAGAPPPEAAPNAGSKTQAGPTPEAAPTGQSNANPRRPFRTRTDAESSRGKSAAPEGRTGETAGKTETTSSKRGPSEHAQTRSQENARNRTESPKRNQTESSGEKNTNPRNGPHEKPQAIEPIDPRLNPTNLDDAYKILDIEKGSPRSIVGKAHKMLQKRYHSDARRENLSPTDKVIADRNSKTLAEAYERIFKSWPEVEI